MVLMWDVDIHTAADTLTRLREMTSRRAVAAAVNDLRTTCGESKMCGEAPEPPKEGLRWPTEPEEDKGIPSNFLVQEVQRKTGGQVDKYYYSPSGVKYRSVAAVNRMLQAQKTLRTFVFDFKNNQHTWVE